MKQRNSIGSQQEQRGSPQKKQKKATGPKYTNVENYASEEYRRVEELRLEQYRQQKDASKCTTSTMHNKDFGKIIIRQK